MKILLDANLSFRLINKLSPVYPNCLHVERTGLPIPAEDAQIWAWAKANEYMMVSNDEDFYHLASAYGFPPKVILLRMGNQSTGSIATILLQHQSDLQQLHESKEHGLLEFF